MITRSHCSKSSFLSKNSTLISRENCRFFWGWKTRENVVDLDFLAVDNLDFTRKIVKKIWVKNLWKCWGVCQNWIFGQKLDFSNSVLCKKNILQAFPTLYLQTCQIRRSLMHINLHYEKRLQSVRICLFCTLSCPSKRHLPKKKSRFANLFFLTLLSLAKMGLKFRN